MNSLLLIWGAGGHGKVVLDVARSTGSFDPILFLDDAFTKVGVSLCGCSVMASSEGLYRFSGNVFAIAIGDNRTRAECFSRACESGLLAIALIHTTAVVSPSARVGAGTVVMPGAIINAGAAIGEDCIVNTGAVIEHDCQIANHVHISPRVALGGGVHVGSFAHVGIGATVLPGARVGEAAVVGAGAVVLKEAPAHCTVAGVPSKVLAST